MVPAARVSDYAGWYYTSRSDVWPFGPCRAAGMGLGSPRGRPTNPARDTHRRNRSKRQQFHRLVLPL